jgi:hypothetical protein
VFSVDASDPLDVVVCDEADAEAWSDGEMDEEADDDELPLPAGYEGSATDLNVNVRGALNQEPGLISALSFVFLPDILRFSPGAI